MEDPSKILVDELRSLLDEATILSIIHDYNLENPNEFAAARQVLLTISKDVEAEEATGFNPSGLGVDDVVDINSSNRGDNVERSGTTNSDIKSIDGFTPITESSVPPSLVSAGSSRTSTGETPGLIHVNIFDGLSDGEKEHQLTQMFVSLKPLDVKLVLQKSKGDANLAIDELLNLQWLEQTGQRPKGVDGFFVPDDDSAPSKKRKKKGGKKKRVVKATTPKSPTSESPAEEADNSDLVQADHIALISDRLSLTSSEVMSIYRRHNASPGATVIEILDNYIALDLPSSDPHLLSNAQVEMGKFSWVPPEYIKAALEICATRDDAEDIIRVLADHFEKPSYMKYDVSYSVVASDLEVVTAKSKIIDVSKPKQLPKLSTNMRSSGLQSPRQNLTSPSNLQSVSATSRTLAESRDHSFKLAAAAFKKGRSDPLFRQAGAYYAERAHEQAMSYRQAGSIEANYLVDQQSTRDSIDLHGVTVQDGVDIALDRVWKWWQSLGEERVRKAKQGFTVITGLGRHAADGKSRLRINVFKALVADRWKVEVLTGSYLVTGRR